MLHHTNNNENITNATNSTFSTDKTHPSYIKGYQKGLDLERRDTEYPITGTEREHEKQFKMGYNAALKNYF